MLVLVRFVRWSGQTFGYVSRLLPRLSSHSPTRCGRGPLGPDSVGFGPQGVRGLVTPAPSTEAELATEESNKSSVVRIHTRGTHDQRTRKRRVLTPEAPTDVGPTARQNSRLIRQVGLYIMAPGMLEKCRPAPSCVRQNLHGRKILSVDGQVSFQIAGARAEDEMDGGFPRSRMAHTSSVPDGCQRLPKKVSRNKTMCDNPAHPLLAHQLDFHLRSAPVFDRF